MTTPPAIEIYDTTLRDGTQGEGINLSLADKLALTQALDWFGAAWIEGGWPGSNPKDEAYFAEVRRQHPARARIAAFGSTRHVRNRPEDDPNLQKLVAAQADAVTIFGKAWDLHVTDALRVSLQDNVDMVASSLAFLVKATGRPVFFDAEHFFDGWRANPAYAIEVLRAAHGAGAGCLVLCDTNGGSLPGQVAEAVRAVRAALPQARLGIHAHNDSACAVANSLAAIEAGCTHVQGTVNGVGERCGNADLLAVIANCELKLGRTCLPAGQLQRLTETSRLVWERLNVAGPVNQPFTGRAAFAHKGGIHVSAVQRNSATYEHVAPEKVGNERRILISELSGRSNVQAKLAAKFPQLADGALLKTVLDQVVERENAGYSYEAAEASFELLVRRTVGGWRPSFRLVHHRIHGLGTEGEHRDLVEATVKVQVGDEPRLTVAEGHGPVDALSHALRAALEPSYPRLKDLHLTDYKVRVVDSADGTAAKVRVLIEHHWQGREIATIGVDENIIAASWEALVEAVEYALAE